MRVTIKDIALCVGVSANTVTKALNDKPKVSEQMRETIKKTARDMGYRPNRSAKALARNETRIGVIYPKEPSEYYGTIQKGLEAGIRELMDYKVTGVFAPVTDIDAAEEMRAALARLKNANIDGLVLSPGVNFEQYYDSIKEVIGAQIPITTLTVDIEKEDRIGCVGLNGNVAGRMAAQLINMSVDKAKPCVILSCSKEILSQKNCIDGFLAEAESRGMTVRGIYETQDDKQIAYYLVERILNKIPDLGAIYICSYNSVAVCNKLEEMGVSEEVFVIGQDIYPELVKKIQNGSLNVTLFQNPYLQAKSAVMMMYEFITEGKLPKSDKLFTPTIVLKSNLESFSNT